jgi:hypothetical protein
MFRAIRLAMVGACAVAAVALAAGQETFGKGVAVTNATSIKALYDNPAEFVGKTIRIDGVITAVCEEMGCWMAIGDSADAERVVRLKVDENAGIVFPVSAKGKTVSAEGVFEKIAATDKDAQEAAAEQGATAKGAAAEFGKLYQLKGTGAIVR